MGVENIVATMAARELTRSKRICIAYLVMVLFLVGALFLIGVRLLLNPLIGRETLDRDALMAATSGLVYCTVLICVGLFLNISSTQLVRTKASGTIESLLATTLTARNLWRATSAASIIPGIVTGGAGGLLSAIVLELVYLAPKGMTLFRPWVIVNCFVLAPGLYLALAFLVHAVGLRGKATSGAVIAQIFFPVYISLAINLGARNILAVGKVDLAMVQVGIALLAAAAAALSARDLTKERIVLSCRG